MFENRFQKASNLVMEMAIAFVFIFAFIFENADSTSTAEIIAIVVIFLSQIVILIMTVSKTVKDVLINTKSKKSARINATRDIMLKRDNNLDKSERIETKTPAMDHINICEDFDQAVKEKLGMPNEESKCASQLNNG